MPICSNLHLRLCQYQSIEYFIMNIDFFLHVAKMQLLHFNNHREFQGIIFISHQLVGFVVALGLCAQMVGDIISAS